MELKLCQLVLSSYSNILFVVYCPCKQRVCVIFGLKTISCAVLLSTKKKANFLFFLQVNREINKKGENENLPKGLDPLLGLTSVTETLKQSHFVPTDWIFVIFRVVNRFCKPKSYSDIYDKDYNSWKQCLQARYPS